MPRGKAAGSVTPATLALIIEGHTTKIEQMQSAMEALQATVARLERLLPSDASVDIVAMRKQISSYGMP